VSDGRRFEVPAGVRLVRRSAGRGKAPAPPFGLRAYDEAASAVAVLLDAADGVATVAAQLPDPASLPGGTLVVVLAEMDGADGRLLGRLFRSRPVAPRAVRGSALLARGYARIGGEGDLVWGFAPR
jgi:hypothetical protein